MSRTVYALDSEFGLASGGNVNDGTGTSSFDAPPGTLCGLTIDLLDDDHPTFGVGDRVSLTLGDLGFPDATVIRADRLACGAAALVFEGIDSDGDPAQVVWTPGFDLAGWYTARAAAGPVPVFRSREAGAARPVCFARNTRIETTRGPIPVQYLRPGDRLLTLDHGPQDLLWCGYRRHVGLGASAPVVVESGALGNVARLVLSQDHRVILRHPLAQLGFDNPEVLVPVAALVNGSSIRIAAMRRVVYHHLLLERHEVLLAQGTEAESLHLAKGPPVNLACTYRTLPHSLHPDRVHVTCARPALDFAEARSLAIQIGIADGPVPQPPRLLVAA
ncbi:MAG: hypothetical protein CMH12_09775 [Maritimibacter sp.]|nr:hypothetical protein [Maritimibacter sp.]